VTGVQARRVTVANAKEEGIRRGLIEAGMSSNFTESPVEGRSSNPISRCYEMMQNAV